MPGTRLIVAEAGREQEDSEVKAADQAAAVDLLIERLGHLIALTSIAVVGHRVVHGGDRYFQPELITPEILKELRRIVPYDPDHLPGEIEAIETFGRLYPELPQVACFDTAFHHDLPRVAQIIAIPRRYEAAGSVATASTAFRTPT